MRMTFQGLLSEFWVRVATVIGIVLTTFWVSADRSWEPITALIIALAGYISSEISLHQKLTSNYFDRRVYTELWASLPVNGDTMYWLRNHDFPGSYPRKASSGLWSFNFHWKDNAAYEFQEPKRNTHLKKMWKISQKMREIMGPIFTTDKNEWVNIASHIRYDDAKSFEIGKQLNQLACEFVQEYDELIRLSRNLDISPHDYQKDERE